MSRKQFIEAHGATCQNWNWSWSFVNHKDRFIIFGAWDRYTDGKTAVILSEDWRTTRSGHKSAGYDQSREHIRLIEEAGYRLMTFPMKYSEKSEGDEYGPAKIAGFTRKLSEKSLVRVGNTWYAADRDAMIPLAEEIPATAKFPEGGKIQVTINAYERNAKARAACIAHHGLSCSVCEIDFSKTYGHLGEGFIHVHHKVPIGSMADKYEIDPVKELIPVCPNCHAMIHRTEPPLTVSELKTHLRSRVTSTDQKIIIKS